MTMLESRTARRLITWLIATATALLAVTAVAHAASPPITVQAAAANAAFLAYAPPPAGGARALCLVDTGVNPMPDTSPGLVSATALDGGTPNDVDPQLHGTIDAAVAGGAGHGVLGAWPLLKIVSVRATDAPSLGQRPTFEFDDYANGILACTKSPLVGQMAAIALPLSSVIPPTPDQVQEFANAVAVTRSLGIVILAAAGNEPGPVQLPGSQPGVLAVGAGDANNAICQFSATDALTFFAPGCGIDQIDTRGEPFCCGNGTSQATAFAAAVLVALRSYQPGMTMAQAVQQLLATTHNGHLDAAAAFRAAGLAPVVDAGTAAIPKLASQVPVAVARRVPRPSVKRVVWRRGILDLRLNIMPAATRLHAKLVFAHRRPVYVATSHVRLRVRVPLPMRLELRLTRRGVSSASVMPKISRIR